MGPAIVALTGNSSLTNCNFEGDADSLLWEVSPTRSQVVGATELADCDFENCRFQGIGFAGPAEFAAKFRENIAEAPKTLARPDSAA